MKKFKSGKVCAVAGNVKVGNEINMITNWQRIEYITFQHFDRRAFDLMDCITVVSQRFIYRQLMYYKLIKSFNKALKGELQGWGVLKRTGNVKLVPTS